MRFIVDFYRYLTFAFIAATIIGIVFITLALGDSGALGDDAPPYFFLIGAALLATFIISLGTIATFISIHDRHVELVEEIRKIREALDEDRSE